jgi:hypothetical protein
MAVTVGWAAAWVATIILVTDRIQHRVARVTSPGQTKTQAAIDAGEAVVFGESPETGRKPEINGD